MNLKNLLVVKAGAALIVLAIAEYTPAFGVTIGPLDGARDFSFDDTNPGGQAGPGDFTTAPNTSTGGEGFSNFFSSDYALLGSENGAAISAGTSDGFSIALRNFSVTAGDVSKPLQVTFDYAFNGGSQDDLSSIDFFTVDVINPNGNAQGIFDGNASNFSQAYGQVAALPGSFVRSTGNYQLRFTLAEVGSSGNSALGFDNVSVKTVPEPSSAFGTVALGVLGAGYVLRRKLKQQKPPSL